MADKFPEVRETAERVCRKVKTTAEAVVSGCRSIVSRLKENTLPAARRKLWRGFYKTTRIAGMGFNIYLNKWCARSAAQFSFFVLMTLFPLLICVHWFIGMLNENSARFLELLAELLPAAIMEYLTSYLDYITESSSDALLVAGLVMLVTPSAAAFRAMRGILCDIYDRSNRGGLLMFILSFFASVVMLILIYGSMILLFTGSRLLRFFVERFELSDTLLGWNWLRFLVLFAILCFALWLMYRFCAFDLFNARDTFKGHALRGAVAASIVVVAVSILFSWFISLSTNYSLVYGSLASIIILMLWLYTCSNIIILGAIFNKLSDDFENISRRLYVPEDIRTAARHARRTLHTVMKNSRLQNRGGAEKNIPHKKK